MTTRMSYLTIASLFALASLPSAAQEGAQVLFASGAPTVIDAKGVSRVARQGDVLNAGDRLVTPPGGLAQIKLPDGAMLSARPDSEVRLDRIGKTGDKTVLQLNQGSVRVANVDTPTKLPAKPVDIVTPLSTLQIGRGDGEAMHIRKGSPDQTGSFNRVQIGSGVVSTPNGSMALQPLQAGRVAGAGAVPVAIDNFPKTVSQAAPTPAPRAGAPSGAPGIKPGGSQLLTPEGRVAATDNTVSRLASANPNSSIRPVVPAPATGVGMGSLPGARVVGGSTGVMARSPGPGSVAMPTLGPTRIVIAPPPPPPPRTRTQLLGL